MKKSLSITKSNLVILTLIIGLGVFLRFYKLNQVPQGLYWDEAAIAYNAWSIALWNRDEWGQRFPPSFKSFGDYKSPAFIYLLGLTYKLTGLQVDLVRIYPALFGIANIILIYYIAQALKPKSHSFPLLSALFMAINPWAVHFSRIGVEAQLALTLSLLGIILGLYHSTHTAFKYASVISFALSLYAYHNAKIAIPLLLVVFVSYLIQSKREAKPRSMLKPLLVFLILIIPLIYDSVIGNGLERGKSLIIYDSGSIASLPIIGQRLLTNIYSYLTPEFWVQGYDFVGLRHSVPGHGVLYWSVFVCLFLGAIRAIYRRNPGDMFLLAWLVIGLLPATISQGNPHAIRSLLALPPIILLSSQGLLLIRAMLKPKPIGRQVMYVLFGLILLAETQGYVQDYYGSYATNSAPDFQYGYAQAIALAHQYHANEKIIVTTRYGQPYIYTLLYNRITPQEYHFGALNQYEFRSIQWPESATDRLYIASPQEIPPNDPHVIEVIPIPGTQTPMFVIAQK